MKLADLMESQRRVIDSEIARILPVDSPAGEMYRVQRDFISRGGKRWRPILCILVHQALGGKADAVLPFAAGVEMVHNFSLIHDDIEDGDRSRRGNPTTWVDQGVPKAINIGDNLLNKAYESVAGLEERGFSAEQTLWCVRLLCRSMVLLSEGQAMEMEFLERWDVTEDEYLEMVWRKTGVLVSAAASGGAYLAGAKEDVVEAMTEYGRFIGPAFQIIDDVLNVDGSYDRYQKEIGGDIREGKKTLMVIHLLGRATPTEQLKIREILSKPREKTTTRDCSYATRLMRRYGSIAYARRSAEERVRGAREKLMVLPPSVHRDHLQELTAFLVKRDY